MQNLQLSLDHWYNRLTKVEPDMIDLPVNETEHTHYVEFIKNIPKAIESRLHDICGENTAARFVILSTAVAALYYRYQVKQISMATPQLLDAKEEKPHAFLYYLPEVKEEDTFNVVLEQMKKQMKSSFRFSIYDYLELSRTLLINKEVNLFDFQALLVVDSQLHQMDEAYMDKHAIAFIFDQKKLIIHYSQQFDSQIIKQMGEHFFVMLDCFLQNKDMPIDAVSLVSKKIETQLQNFNHKSFQAQEGKTVLDLFDDKVLLYPKKLAVRDGDKTYDYNTLQQRINQIANIFTHEPGYEKGLRVGVSVQRSADLVCIIFGLFKAGLVYVPIDPNLPSKRKQIIAEDCELSYLIADDDVSEWLLQGVVLLESTRWQLSLTETDEVAPKVSIGSDDIAYIIYTSGSTGKPKGVMIGHGSLFNLVAGIPDVLNLAEGDHFLAVTSMSFDISIFDFVALFCQGQSVTIKPDISQLGELDIYVEQEPVKLHHSLYFTKEPMEEDQQEFRKELVRWADQANIHALWFGQEGGEQLPGDATLSVAQLAYFGPITDRVHLRVDKLVLPNNDVVRVAEDFALVDNLSAGRVGLSINQGTVKEQFSFAPQNFEEREKLFDLESEKLRILWNQEEINRVNGLGKEISLRTFPEPVTDKLPLWVSIVDSETDFARAGHMGANLMLELVDFEWSVLEEGIKTYKIALSDAGHDHIARKITMVVAGFITDDEEVQEEVLSHGFLRYLQNHESYSTAITGRIDRGGIKDVEELVSLFHQELSLIGTTTFVKQQVIKLALMGVTELAWISDLVDDPIIIKEQLQKTSSLLEEVLDKGCPSTPVNALQTTPSLLKAILRDPYSSRFIKSLQKILVAGEPFPKQLLEKIAEVSEAEVYNGYGPTEATIYSSIKRLRLDEHTITIGSPFPNTQIHIVDDRGKLVPPGVAGQILLAGNGLGLGYWNQKGLTSECFRMMQQNKSTLVYETGDLGRWLPNGEVEMLGRIDKQVKIRGNRVELEDIEYHLNLHDLVIQSVITTYLDSDDNDYICAYVICEGTVESSVLKNHLVSLLPAYMIPSHFIFVEEIPVTNSGKIDLKKLPLPEESKHHIHVPYVGPRDEIEATLEDIFNETLKLERVGVHENFFDIGGHSIIATLIVSRILNIYGIEFKIRIIFNNPTIESLAREIKGKLEAHIPNKIGDTEDKDAEGIEELII